MGSHYSIGYKTLSIQNEVEGNQTGDEVCSKIYTLIKKIYYVFYLIADVFFDEINTVVQHIYDANRQIYKLNTVVRHIYDANRQIYKFNTVVRHIYDANHQIYKFNTVEHDSAASIC